MCAEASSVNLTSVEIAGAVRELDRCIDGARNRGGDDDSGDVEMGVAAGGGLEGDNSAGGGAVNAGELMRVKQIVLGFDDIVAKLPLQATRGDPRYVRGGDGFRGLFFEAGITGDKYPCRVSNPFGSPQHASCALPRIAPHCSALPRIAPHCSPSARLSPACSDYPAVVEPPRAESYLLLVQQCERCVLKLGEAARFGVSSGSSFNLQKLADALKAAFDTERPPSQYRLCVQEIPERDLPRGRNRGTLDAGPRPRTVGYWCFHSGAAMRQLVNLLRSNRCPNRHCPISERLLARLVPLLTVSASIPWADFNGVAVRAAHFGHALAALELC